MSTILVTGGTGFIGSHLILQLLQAGHDVRTTIRDLKRADDVRAMIKQGGLEPGDNLTFVQADLLIDDNWDEAVKDCEFVHHVASPFPAGVPKHEDDLIIPAREGSLRVLRAARDAGVKRVILTSSFAAIGYGHPERSTPFTEEDWTNPDDPSISAYVKSKALAEKAAWDFIEQEGGNLELSVVNPVAVFGPVLADDYSTSIYLIKRMIDGEMPGCPKMSFGVVDVRDVASLHVLCQNDPKAAGERFMAITGDFMPIKDIGQTLIDGLGDKAAKVKTRELPNFVLRIVSIFDPALKLVVSELGKQRNATNKKAIDTLGWKPHTPQESILATANSLIEKGYVKS